MQDPSRTIRKLDTLIGRPLRAPPSWIERVSRPEREVFVTVSREALRDAPAYDPKTGVGLDEEVRLFLHYGRDLAG